MKPTEKPEFSKKWWLGVKPADVKGTDLEKALQNAEKALAEQKKKSDDEDAIAECLTALEAVSSAVEKTTKKELDKKKDKDLITVLEKFDPLIDSEKSRLEDLQETLGKASDGDDEEDEEESEGKIFEPDYLYKMIKLMKSGGKELRFGFGLNTSTPEASRLLLKRKGKPEMLFKALKRTGEYSNRLMTYGMALADPEDGQTLIFRLDASADEPPQFMKLGRRYLRGDKNLRFRKLKVVLSSGKTLIDEEPDEDEELAAAGGSSGGGQRISPEEMADIQTELKEMEQRLESLFTEHRVTA
jgi:hypothetical protein